VYFVLALSESSSNLSRSDGIRSSSNLIWFPLLAVYIRIIFRSIYLEILFTKVFNIQ
jgi:hypothetical protein